MNREDIIRMAQEKGVTAERVRDLVNFAALVASAEREIWEHKYARLQSLMDVRETQPNKPCCLAEREACADVADRLPRIYRETKEAHERATLEPFIPSRFGFDFAELRQAEAITHSIRARGQ